MLPIQLKAQQALDLKKRHSFATSYFGMDVHYFGALQKGMYLNDQNQLEEFDRNSFFTPAINLGATHFWGHADFFVSIAFPPIKLNADLLENSIRFRAITGMRVFPLAIKEKSLRPFLSYKFAPIRLNQSNREGEPYRKTEVKSIFGGGLAYQTKNVFAYLSYDYIPNHQSNIYLSRTQTAASSFPERVFTVGINYSIDLTIGSYTEPVKKLDSILSNKNTLGWFVGIGPSSAFPTQSSSYIADLYPFLDDRAMPSVFPEISLGYHFSKQDVILSTNFRPISQRREAFSFIQKLNRKSFGFEAYKFLLDFHGFVPFVGAGVLFEHIELFEADDHSPLTQERYNITTPSLLFGWDIRPGK